MGRDKLIYFEQEEPPEGVLGLVEEYDQSPSYEVDMGAVFRTVNGFRGVVISGCS